jgi:hypothetical protein
MKALLGLLVATAALSSTALAHGGRHHHSARTCAMVYDSVYRCDSKALKVKDGTKIADLNDFTMWPGYQNWDNQISKIDVRPGCKFVGYQYQNFDINYYSGYPMYGFKKVIDNRGGGYNKSVYLSSYKADKISSLKCSCN